MLGFGHTLTSLSLANVAVIKVWLGKYKPQSMTKLDNKFILYGRWTIWLTKCGKTKLWPKINTYQIAKLWMTNCGRKPNTPLVSTIFRERNIGGGDMALVGSPNCSNGKL